MLTKSCTPRMMMTSTLDKALLLNFRTQLARRKWHQLRFLTGFKFYTGKAMLALSQYTRKRNDKNEVNFQKYTWNSMQYMYAMTWITGLLFARWLSDETFGSNKMFILGLLLNFKYTWSFNNFQCVKFWIKLSFESRHSNLYWETA